LRPIEHPFRGRLFLPRLQRRGPTSATGRTSQIRGLDPAAIPLAGAAINGGYSPAIRMAPPAPDVKSGA
jgi:hypothetical protein